MWSRVAGGRPVVFVDTGFLFEETLVYRDDLARKLGLTIEIARPKVARKDFLAKHGYDIPFVDSDFCCGKNKVDPIAGHVARARGWVSGLRRDQSEGRRTIPILERSPQGPIKVYPLATVTMDDVRAYYAEHALPEHPLRERRYLSIGCEPCTRPVDEGEDARAGRWAGKGKTECGLHTTEERK
jgi:phosphoadenosine phosphosulfate reductase